MDVSLRGRGFRSGRTCTGALRTRLTLRCPAGVGRPEAAQPSIHLTPCPSLLQAAARVRRSHRRLHAFRFGRRRETGRRERTRRACAGVGVDGWTGYLPVRTQHEDAAPSPARRVGRRSRRRYTGVRAGRRASGAWWKVSGVCKYLGWRVRDVSVLQDRRRKKGRKGDGAAESALATPTAEYAPSRHDTISVGIFQSQSPPPLAH
ncbi:hypothetical protein B0H10DRAFT_1096283 [Mycena sp. CBHHK59/15]|nr:hypothetical protein B0H10DRAFT_1096283 [Mycena sp. CBHHK59/15]